MLIVIGVLYVIREHFNHVCPYLPCLILLICPLKHFLVMAIRQQPTRTKKGNSHASHTEQPRPPSRPCYLTQ
ncbi:MULTISPECIES: DUF2933 domain-containing protein [unclassified Pseudomonas]|uniref:DUF2933 domain-containing protein n=1 Tax=unclassified Pseudomonas TaxID=196821 RepID=UPI00273DDD5F|nr:MULTISPECIES: DUF2933 domain-containing protein [unclassified Pseudomonas]